MSRAPKGNGSIRRKTITRSGKKYNCWEGRVTIGRDPGTGKQIQKSFTGKTQKEVVQKMQSVVGQVTEGTYTEPSKITVREWVEIWQKEYLGDVKPHTLATYSAHIRNHIVPTLGAVKLKALSTPQIQHLYNDLTEKGKKK